MSMSMFNRPIIRQVRGKVSLLVITICFCLVLLFTEKNHERDMPNQLMKSPYANPILNLQDDRASNAMQIQQSTEKPKIIITKSPANNTKTAIKEPVPKPQTKLPDPPEGKSKAGVSNVDVTIDDPLSSRPDLTMTTQTRGYPYLLNTPTVCSDPPELIVIVCSVPNNFEKRMAVRQTWGSDVDNKDFKMKMVFLTGGSYTAENQRDLKSESDEFRDIVQKDFIDSYMNLTLKSLVMLEWVSTFCNRSKYLLKADDDMYFNLPNLIRALREHKEDKFIMGHLHDKGIPVRDKRSKWYIPREMYPLDNYPPFTVGVGYSMTTKAGQLLYTTALSMSFFPMEDVYVTGIVGSKAGIPRFNNDGFYDKWREPSCNYTRTIAEHKHEPKEMYAIHELLTSGACV